VNAPIRSRLGKHREAEQYAKGTIIRLDLFPQEERYAKRRHQRYFRLQKRI
jgi:hypothetical protein